MQEHERDHGRRTPIVGGQQEVRPRVEVDRAGGFPRRRSRRRVEERQEDTGDDLHDHAEQRRAAEDVPITGAAGDVLGQKIFGHRDEAGAFFDPIQHQRSPMPDTRRRCVAVYSTDTRSTSPRRDSALRAQRQRIETARRGPCDMRSVEGVLRTVARAHEAVLFVAPVVVAAQVRTDRAEDDEAHRDRRIGQVAVRPGTSKMSGRAASNLSRSILMPQAYSSAACSGR